MILLIGVAGALTLGFLSGLFAFKIKQCWCPVCGVTKTCPQQHRVEAGARSVTDRTVVGLRRSKARS
jgi:hypothetical protein